MYPCCPCFKKEFCSLYSSHHILAPIDKKHCLPSFLVATLPSEFLYHEMTIRYFKGLFT